MCFSQYGTFKTYTTRFLIKLHFASPILFTPNKLMDMRLNCFFFSSFQKFASNSLDRWKRVLGSISIQEMLLFNLVSRTIQKQKYIIVYTVKPLGLFCPSVHVQFTSICSVNVLPLNCEYAQYWLCQYVWGKRRNYFHFWVSAALPVQRIKLETSQKPKHVYYL